MENTSEGTHSNKNSLSISGEESAGLTFGLPPHSLEDAASAVKRVLDSLSVCPPTHLKMQHQR